MTQPSVLVIDDDAAVRGAVAEDLKREGYDLHFATNGKEGLSRLQEIDPTVIILDLRMPVMDGREFLTQLRLQPSDPYSVIVLTAYGDADAVESCYDAGVSTFLKKPFNLFEIRGVVKNAIAIKKLSTHLEELVQERTVELEQRLREITALNKFFQSHLEWRSVVDSNYNEIGEELQRISNEINDRAIRAQTEPFIYVPDLPSPDLPSPDLPSPDQPSPNSDIASDAN